MKKGVVAGIVIGILALGGIGGSLTLPDRAEHYVRDAIARAALPGYDRAECDDVRISLLQRTVTISNLRLAGPGGEHRCRELTLRPTFPLMLATAVPPLRPLLLPTSGPVILGTMEAQDIAGHVIRDIAPLSLETGAAALSILDVQLDASLLDKLLNGEKFTVPDLAGRAGAARIHAASVRLRQPNLCSVEIKKLLLNDVLTNFSSTLCEAEDVSIADTSGGMNKSCSLLRLTDISIPPDILKTIIADMPLFPSGLERAVANAAAKHTLYRNVTLENGTLSFGDPETCSVKRVFSDVAPDMRKGILQIERLYIPPRLLFGELPHILVIDKLLLNCTWEHARNNDRSRENISLTVADMGHITTDLEYTANVDLLSPDADLQTLLGVQFKKVYIRYEDRGGIARILAGQEHPTETLRQLDMLAAQFSALLSEASKPLIEALRTTLRTPGTLEIRLREGMEITVPELLADIASHELGRSFEASAVPGKEDVTDQILRVQTQ